MLIVSLVLNIVVLVPVVALLTRGRPRGPWGERTAARDILLAVYASILVLSTALLIALATVGPTMVVETSAMSLFAVQITYKVLTTVTVRDALRNPVVISNVAIAVVHAVTVVVLAPALLG